MTTTPHHQQSSTTGHDLYVTPQRVIDALADTGAMRTTPVDTSLSDPLSDQILGNPPFAGVTAAGIKA